MLAYYAEQSLHIINSLSMIYSKLLSGHDSIFSEQQAVIILSNNSLVMVPEAIQEKLEPKKF